ncbi:hypothetical protein ACLKA6_003893 [Drosophila palustris]
MSASYALSTDDRLTKDVIPSSYELQLEPNYEECTFSGLIKMNLIWKKDSKKISFHAHFDLNINDRKIKLQKVDSNSSNMNTTYVTILRGSRIPKKTIYVVYLKETIMQGTQCVLEVPFEGNIWSSAEGFFTGSFANVKYFATNLGLNNARRLFPCFDEPEFKVPFTVSITRHKDFVTVFNTPLNQTHEHPTLQDHVIDYFEKTPPMSSFTIGFVISNLKKCNVEGLKTPRISNLTVLEQPEIEIWTLADRQIQFEETYEKILTIYKRIQDYFGVTIPLSKVDVIVIPDLSIVRPVNNWGLLLLKESDLLNKGYYDLTQEFIYQWIGLWVTPEWWNDAHLSKALASFLASEIAIQIDGGVEFNGKYPMTTLYSLYYEFKIAPFPVNYDDENWRMLGNFMQTDVGRKTVPPYTRAKLLHDAWNLAYAGDLSFTIAFNMTLFMKFERNHIVWNPVFTFIDQIGRHIDMSEVHSKFEAYVLFLLTPLYEELGNELKTEENWKTDLRSLTKRFLCQAGYKPCIEEAQEAFRNWQHTVNPNFENPVPSHYMCPVFKWGSLDEWQFGLQRVMQFPKSRKQSERTHLLKALAGCPTQPEKINQLLQTSILEKHSNFTENDQFLILTSLTGGSSGYYSLLNFLTNNWMAIRERLKNKTNLWDHLIGSATGFFLTQKGYDMVHRLYEERSGVRTITADGSPR